MTKAPNNFCSAPWVGTYVDPSGYVSPCCITRGGVGNINDKNFTQIYREDMRKLQEQFLNNERPEMCESCWKQEKYFPNAESYRQSFNKRYAHYIPDILNGSHPGTIYYWDLRPSNNCNLGCLMCSEGLSSGYWQMLRDLKLSDAPTDKFRQVTPEKFEDLVALVQKTLWNSEEFHFYFAGGEPLILDHHKRLLLWLYDNNYRKVNLRYNTNCSTLKYKGTDFVDIWEQWETPVVIDVSLDSVGDALEYQRYGSSWSRIQANLTRLADNPNIRLTYNLTTGLITYDNLLNTVDELERIDGDNLVQRLRFTPITRPSRWDLRMIPRDKLNTDILDELDRRGYSTDKLRSVVIQHYDEFEQHVREQTPHWDRTELWRQNKRFFDSIKQLKGRDICDIVPWIREYI